MATNKLLTPAEIDAQADKFEKAAKSLREAASILREGVLPEPPSEKRAGNPKGRTGTKAKELAEFLKLNGPMRRSEILKNCKTVKPNTIKFLLGDRRFFDKDEEGRYFAKG